MRGLKQWIVLVLLLPGFSWAQQKIAVTFTYDPPVGLEVRSVSLRGSFNNWAELPMQKTEEGVWQVVVELPPGLVQYKFFINGQWPRNMCEDETFGTPQVDLEAERCEDDGQGGQNALREVGRAADHTPDTGGLAFVHDPNRPQFVSQAAGRLSVRFQVPEGSIQRAVLLADRPYPMAPQLTAPDGEVWRAALPLTVKAYRIQILDKDGQEQTFGPYQTPARPFRAVDWVAGRVGYQIFPDRFWNGDPRNDRRALETSQARFDQTWTGRLPYLSRWSDPPGDYHCCQQYYGGDLAGVLQRLPHLRALGVNLIYFNPLFDSGSAHGYDTHDYVRVAPRLGDNALLRRVLAEARRQGIKVIFDFVPNHTGLGHWAFQDVVIKGPDSRYWNWYFIRAWPFTPGDGRAYVGWADLGSLPKLNTANPEVQDYLIRVSRYWLNFGFDGIRVDVANEIAPEFVQKWRAALKALKPEVYLVGEVWDLRPQYLQGDQFDSLMNYTVGRGGSPPALGGALGFARGGPLQSGRRVLSELARVYATYPEAVAAMGFNLIGSHDTPRVLTDLGGGGWRESPSPEALARLRLASAILYALPGASVFFQGEECGFTGERGQWPVNELYRYPLQWDKCRADVLEHYRLLGRLKGQLKAFRSPLFRTYQGEGSLLAFLRGEPGVGEVLAAFNNGTERVNLRLPAGQWRDAVEGRAYQAQVELPGLGWRYLERVR
ncbi:MAG: alpha-amylase family glycosyl hydrolase [Meiothermus sp.]|uniref:alpha-amylase family glycosyl hydrolase n=1 Tax=Meiothermus sp. TaxID=1955249 RepID=UPI0025EAD4A2|nr:alpha-amylase family glycosyl hydrolase [Meiothermus sp.]MCS7068732.1 alpha-amylase family glycosyl hydrolase [Meiothermus sp.]